MKKLAATIFALLLLIMLYQVYLQPTGSLITPITLTTSSPDNVTVYFLDVGQGDSILVKTPTKNILIDGGPTDAGSAVVNDLIAYNVPEIDLMVATHPHADHIGGLISVLQSNIPVQDIVYNGYNYTTTQTFNEWKTLALMHNLTQGYRGQIYAMSPTINFTVISPTSPTQFGSTTSGDDINANSIVMKLQVGNTSVLLSGDAQFDTEEFMVSSGSNMHSQILKVGHHGSSTSTSQEFLSAVTPTYGIISAGLNNQYGHPTQQTLGTLSANNIIAYGTYAYGTVVFSLNSATSNPTPTTTPTATPTPSPSPSPSPSPLPAPMQFVVDNLESQGFDVTFVYNGSNTNLTFGTEDAAVVVMRTLEHVKNFQFTSSQEQQFKEGNCSLHNAYPNSEVFIIFIFEDLNNDKIPDGYPQISGYYEISGGVFGGRTSTAFPNDYWNQADRFVLVNTITPTPTPSPSPTPTATPTSTPTATPTATPTSTPTQVPTSNPTTNPTQQPTSNPTATATDDPPPMPTPTVPEFPALVFLPLFIAVLSIALLAKKGMARTYQLH